jgi:hypothetical protein
MTLKMDKRFIDLFTKQFGIPQIVEIYRGHEQSIVIPDKKSDMPMEQLQEKIEESNVISSDAIARLNHLNHLSDELEERKNKSTFQLVKDYFRDLYHKKKIKNNKTV